MTFFAMIVKKSQSVNGFPFQMVSLSITNPDFAMHAINVNPRRFRKIMCHV